MFTDEAFSGKVQRAIDTGKGSPETLRVVETIRGSFAKTVDDPNYQASLLNAVRRRSSQKRKRRQSKG